MKPKVSKSDELGDRSKMQPEPDSEVEDEWTPRKRPYHVLSDEQARETWVKPKATKSDESEAYFVTDPSDDLVIGKLDLAFVKFALAVVFHSWGEGEGTLSPGSIFVGYDGRCLCLCHFGATERAVMNAVDAAPTKVFAVTYVLIFAFDADRLGDAVLRTPIVFCRTGRTAQCREFRQAPARCKANAHQSNNEC